MSSQKSYVLAIDLGTGGPKVALVSLEGELIAHKLVTIETNLLSHGGATQDPNSWWEAITNSTRKLLEEGYVQRDKVVAISCTGQWGSTIAVDETGNAIADCILWMDTRGHPYSAKVLGGPLKVSGYGPTKVLRFVRKTAGAPSPLGNDPVGHVLYLKNEEPDIYREAAWFLEPVDYLNMRFTGKATASAVSMILWWIVDTRNLSNPNHQPRYAYELVRLVGIDQNKLPPLVPTGEVVGTILPKVAEELGLNRDTKVVTGIPDLHSACAGSGGINDYDPHMAISTTAWLSCHVPAKKTDPFRQIATVAGMLKDRYLLANNHDTAGICLQWLRDNIITACQDGLTKPDGITQGYAALDNIAESVPVGSNGLIFAPWLAGERCPVYDRTLRGSFHNLSLSTTRSDMIRAVFEGVAYNARWMLQAVEHFVGKELGPVRFIGGGAVSDTWCQIHADIMNKTVLKVRDPLYANARGAALFTALSLGAVKKEDIPRLVSIERTFKPNPDSRKTYDEIYPYFPRLYKMGKKMYAHLNKEGKGTVNMPIAKGAAKQSTTPPSRTGLAEGSGSPG